MSAVGNQCVHEIAPLAIGRIERLCFGRKDVAEFIKLLALPGMTQISAWSAYIPVVMVGGVWRRGPVCKDRQHPDFKSLVVDFFPHQHLESFCCGTAPARA